MTFSDPADDPYDEQYALRDWARAMTTDQLEYGIQRSQAHHYTPEEQAAVREELARREAGKSS